MEKKEEERERKKRRERERLSTPRNMNNNKKTTKSYIPRERDEQRNGLREQPDPFISTLSNTRAKK